jgi:hypothetical protein
MDMPATLAQMALWDSRGSGRQESSRGQRSLITPSTELTDSQVNLSEKEVMLRTQDCSASS